MNTVNGDNESGLITITKLDAARRQLDTAVSLWFADGDPVAIHVLVFSAYEIIHTLARKRGVSELLFDNSVIKEECRADFCKQLKKSASFFKHAQKDAEGTIEFSPELSEPFFTYCIVGLQSSREPLSDKQFAYMRWDAFQNPEKFNDAGLEALVHSVPVDKLNEIRKLSKCEFFKGFVDARNIARAAGHIK